MKFKEFELLSKNEKEEYWRTAREDYQRKKEQKETAKRTTA